MSSFESLTTAIKAKLDGLIGTTSGKLSKVYDYHETAPAGFPAASFEPSQLSNEAYTSSDNLRGYAFDIIVQQEFSSMTRQAAVGILRRTVDAIIAAFDADYTLGGACHYTAPLPGQFGFFTGANGAILWASLTIICYDEALVIS